MLTASLFQQALFRTEDMVKMEERLEDEGEGEDGEVTVE